MHLIMFLLVIYVIFSLCVALTALEVERVVHNHHSNWWVELLSAGGLIGAGAATIALYVLTIICFFRG